MALLSLFQCKIFFNVVDLSFLLDNSLKQYENVNKVQLITIPVLLNLVICKLLKHGSAL